MAGDLCDKVGILDFFIQVADQGADDDIVMPDPRDGYLLYGHEMVKRVEEFLLQVTLLFGHHTDLGNHEPLPVLIPVVRMSVQVRFSPLIEPSMEKSD